MENSVNEKRNLLKTRIEKTKHARINAYKRCLERKKYFKIICFMYNLLVIILSVFSLVLEDVCSESIMTWISVSLIVVSIVAFSVDLLVASIDYGEMAEQYKFIYIKLDKLLTELSETEDSKINELETRYIDLMDHSINHDEVDFARYIVESDIENKENKYPDLIKVYKKKKSEEILLNFFSTLGFYLLYIICIQIVAIFIKDRKVKK